MEKDTLVLSDLDKNYAPDKDLADLYIGQNSKNEEINFKVAQAGNPLHEKMQRKYAKKIERYRNFPKKLSEVYEEIVGISILKEMENLLDDDGNIVASTQKNRIAILHQYRAIFVKVLDTANDINNYLDDPEDEDEDGDDGEIITEIEAKADTRKNLKK